MIVIHCYLEIDNNQVLKFNMSNSSYFEIITSLF